MQRIRRTKALHDERTHTHTRSRVECSVEDEDEFHTRNPGQVEHVRHRTENRHTCIEEVFIGPSLPNVCFLYHV